MKPINIRAEFKKNDHTTVVNLPCNDYGIDIALANLGETDMTKTNHFCSHIGGEIRELAVLEDRFIDVDELNFLAKYLDSFTDNQVMQFRAAMTVTKPTEIKDMINLAFNLHNYTLISDFSDMEKVCRTHRLNVEMAIPVESDDSYDYAELGRNLVNSGNGTLTPYGVLYTNNLPMQEVYNGQTFPQYFYEDCLISAALEYNDKDEFLYMPCSETAIDRALKRLEANSLADCKLMEVDTSFDVSVLDKICPEYFNHAEDVIGLNDLSAVLTEMDWKDADTFEKLIAVCDYAGVHDFSKAAVIADNMDSFEFAPDVQDADNLGEYLIKESGHYAYDEELDDYYGYESLGEDTMDNQNGKFTEYGYVGIRDDITLDEILGENNMTMGGMQL